jgi:hypothetical protein
MCQILYDYMDMHLCIDKAEEVGLTQYVKDKDKIWSQIRDYFRKDNGDVLIDAPNSQGMYMLRTRFMTGRKKSTKRIIVG